MYNSKKNKYIIPLVGGKTITVKCDIFSMKIGQYINRLLSIYFKCNLLDQNE